MASSLGFRWPSSDFIFCMISLDKDFEPHVPFVVCSSTPNHLMPYASLYISLKYCLWSVEEIWSAYLSPFAWSTSVSVCELGMIERVQEGFGQYTQPYRKGKLCSIFHLLIAFSGARMHVKFLIRCLISFVLFFGSQLSRMTSRSFSPP